MESDEEDGKLTIYKEISTVKEVDESCAVNEQSSLPGDSLGVDDVVPYHEQFLIDLLGRSVAESYLHPVIDVSVGVVGMTANLHGNNRIKVQRKRKRMENVTLEKLRSNATRLWESLRQNSGNEIHMVDSRIPVNLKQSFNSFARGMIDQNLTPPQRGFSDDSEVTDLARAVKASYIGATDIDRRRRQLMLGLSRVHEDNQAALMRDKSFLASQQNHDGIKELYFPPIMKSPAPSIKEIDTREFHSKTMFQNLDIPIVNEEELFTKKSSALSHLRFFTESDSRRLLDPNSGFRRRMRAGTDLEVEGDDGGAMLHTIAQSRRWQKRDERRQQCSISSNNSHPGSDTDFRHEKKHSSPSTEVGKVDCQQPLTLGAVMDVKIVRKPTLGMYAEDAGGFRQGAARLWRPKMAAIH